MKTIIQLGYKYSFLRGCVKPVFQVFIKISSLSRKRLLFLKRSSKVFQTMIVNVRFSNKSTKQLFLYSKTYV